MIEINTENATSVAELRFSAAAAATLHQTQSALSHQFSDSEQRLGFRLFVRKSQPLRFTPQGEILLQLANQVLPQIASALQACNEPQQTRASPSSATAVFSGRPPRWRISIRSGRRWRWHFNPASPSTRSRRYSRASWIWR
ncbi:LysR family transcriptional regulator [Shigella flexneri]